MYQVFNFALWVVQLVTGDTTNDPVINCLAKIRQFEFRLKTHFGVVLFRHRRRDSVSKRNPIKVSKLQDC